jgi:xanthine dehydrogenase YagT iron-sulfur-binding subunit
MHVRPFAGEAPLILAFADQWTLDGEGVEDIAAIRAELRGLGARMLVVSKAGAWYFRPDDDVESFEKHDPALDAEIARLAAEYGVAGESDGTFAPGVFLLDGERSVCLARGSPWGALPMHATLAEALAAAGRERITKREPAATALTRREWLLGALVAGFAVAFAEGCGRLPAPGVANRAPSGPPAARPSDGEVDIVLNVNGLDRPVRIDPRVSLLDALRERMGLTGSKKGCDHGQCGACTVLVGGRRVCSCLTLAIMTQGQKVTTIEGLANGDMLHPMQAAFVAQDGLQCGYCTPGQIMSAVGLLAEGHANTDDEVREQMSGNICRCGAYPNIVAAVQLARKGA